MGLESLRMKAVVDTLANRARHIWESTASDSRRMPDRADGVDDREERDPAMHQNLELATAEQSVELPDYAASAAVYEAITGYKDSQSFLRWSPSRVGQWLRWVAPIMPNPTAVIHWQLRCGTAT